MSEQPQAPKTAAIRSADFTQYWRERKIELRTAELNLWTVRDEMIDKRADCFDEKEAKDLGAEIEQLAIAAEIVADYAVLAGVNSYPEMVAA